MTESCRLITTEQYQEYLKLKEEHKPLSWEELKEEAKKMGYDVNYTADPKYSWLAKDKFDFICDGTILCLGVVIANERTPEQMLMIMRGLE